jgi:hypothetical protein
MSLQPPLLPLGGVSISDLAYERVPLTVWLIAINRHRRYLTGNVIIIERDSDRGAECEVTISTLHIASNGVRFVVSTELAIPITTVELDKV